MEPINRDLALKMLNSSRLINASNSNKIDAIQTMVNSVEMLFGMVAKNLHEDFFHVVYDQILSDYPECTVEDLENAFRYQEIEKKPGQSLTRDEFMKPIKRYFNRKSIVITAMQMEHKYQLEQIAAKNQFFIDSVKAYQEGIRTKRYRGSFSNANQIAKPYLAEKFSQDEKNEIAKLALRMESYFKLLRHKRDEVAKKEKRITLEVVPVPDYIYFYSWAMCRFACRKGVFITVD